ncbi:hypothetical protein T190115A13A_110005 [Tenacibaculum sp. 190524A02b]|uniref:Uncharacterized protein n=1 Tax=Tenacibaculum vairaonense TaxID=3137860 RepID=A0ABP1F7Z8_9FLAO
MDSDKQEIKNYFYMNTENKNTINPLLINTINTQDTSNLKL